MTNYNPYIVIPSVVADKVSKTLELALAMANKSYPHLVAEIENAQKHYRESALSFIGSEKIPSGSKKAYR